MEPRTGDLFLFNRWSVESILNHAADPTSKWSNAGVFVVEHGTDNIPQIKVFVLGSKGAVLLDFDELMSDPTIQAAAHRRLDIPRRSEAVRKMTAYMNRLLDHEIIPVSPVVKSILGQDYMTMEETSIGSKVDSRGRDVAVSGFRKGDPNSSKMKKEFSNADVIASILAEANLINYDPSLAMSTFQEGGDLDQLFGQEEPMFPRKHQNDETARMEFIVDAAKKEAEKLVMAYLEAKPIMNYARYQAEQAMIKGKKDALFATAKNEMYIETGDYPASAVPYPEIESNSFSTASTRQRKADTTALAEDAESKTMEAKIRERNKGIEGYVRPAPKYKQK